MKLKEFEKIEIVERFPQGDNFKHGVLYYNKVIRMLKYFCPCGKCEQKEALAIADTFDRAQRLWSLEINEGKATVQASVGSGNQCKSHYFIQDNVIL